MDAKFTELLKTWLETPADNRDYTVGALYLLKLSGNKIMYRNLIKDLNNKREFIEYQLQKYYNFRVQALTHQQVKSMEAQVRKIADTCNLAAPARTTTPKGKRDDHDTLPDDLKAKYVENLDLLHRMRELHLKLRSLTLTDSPCPDSERYPFLKELIRLDKKMRSNWKEYDSYIPPAADARP